MRILVIGGSSFVGRHMAERAVAEGHSVSLFNRGRTSPAGVAGTEHLQGNRDNDLSSLAGRDWDACIDVCAYVPRQVEFLLDELGARLGLYTLISTLSVYPDDVPAGFDESAPVVEPSYDTELTMERYGALKVACELTARAFDTCVIRPGFVIGPFDRTHRFAYWVERVAAGGRMLGPDPDQPLQMIDGRDLAAFVLGLLARGTTGTFNATAPDPAFRFSDVLASIAEGLGVPPPDVVWGAAHDLLPLTVPPEYTGLLRADLSKALASGLAWRRLEETATDTLAWVRAARAAGGYETGSNVLTPEQEAELLG